MSGGHILHTGDTSSVIAAACGRTWLLDLPHRSPPPADVTVVSGIDNGHHVTYRVIGDARVPAGARPTEPTLEDGYLALTQPTRRRPR